MSLSRSSAAIRGCDWRREVDSRRRGVCPVGVRRASVESRGTVAATHPTPTHNTSTRHINKDTQLRRARQQRSAGMLRESLRGRTRTSWVRAAQCSHGMIAIDRAADVNKRMCRCMRVREEDNARRESSTAPLARRVYRRQRTRSQRSRRLRLARHRPRPPRVPPACQPLQPRPPRPPP
jgi:hypothetical protein